MKNNGQHVWKGHCCFSSEQNNSVLSSQVIRHGEFGRSKLFFDELFYCSIFLTLVTLCGNAIEGWIILTN
jgi:hypothetical protein